jgi:hypothetical protein
MSEAGFGRHVAAAQAHRGSMIAKIRNAGSARGFGAWSGPSGQPSSCLTKGGEMCRSPLGLLETSWMAPSSRQRPAGYPGVGVYAA